MTRPDLKRKREVKNICCIGGGYVVRKHFTIFFPLFWYIVWGVRGHCCDKLIICSDAMRLGATATLPP